jgi:hypothetical protein
MDIWGDGLNLHGTLSYVYVYILSFLDLSGDTDLLYWDRALPSVPSFTLLKRSII